MSLEDLPRGYPIASGPIHVEVTRTEVWRGDEKSEEDPERIVTQYRDLEGELLFELDPIKEMLDDGEEDDDGG